MATFIDIDFADGNYRFALPILQIEELQRKCGAGIGEIYNRVLGGAYVQDGQILLSPGEARFYVLDIIETVRHGLIGGKQGSVNEQPVEVTPPDATRLINAYLKDQPLIKAWEIAFSVLAATMVGYEPKDAPPKSDAGNGEAAAEETQTTDGSTMEQP